MPAPASLAQILWERYEQTRDMGEVFRLALHEVECAREREEIEVERDWQAMLTAALAGDSEAAAWLVELAGESEDVRPLFAKARARCLGLPVPGEDVLFPDHNNDGERIGNKMQTRRE